MNAKRIDQVRREAAADKGRLRRICRLTVDAEATPVKITERPDGSWQLEGVATRGDAVFDYSDEAGEEWREYRSDDDVFAPLSIASLEGSTLTDDHPEDFVNVDNARELTRGVVMKAWRDGHLMRVIVIARDRELLDKIAAGKVELSCGYTAVVVPEAGVHPTEGTYQARQTQIIHNHLAVVDIARAGPVARLAVPPEMLVPAANDPNAGTASGDSIEKQTSGALTTKPVAGQKPIGHMVGGKPLYLAADARRRQPGRKDSMDEIIVNGVPYKVDPNATTVPAALAEAYKALEADLTQKAARITELETAAGQTPTNPNPNPTPANPTPAPPINPEGSMANANAGDQNADKNKDKSGAGGGSPASNLDAAAIGKIVADQLAVALGDRDKKAVADKKAADARANRIADARKVLPDSYVCDGKSDAQILADACTALDKDYKATADALAKSDSAERLHGVLEAKLADAGRGHVRSLGLVLHASNDSGEGGGRKIDADAAQQRMIDKKTGKKAAGEGK